MSSIKSIDKNSSNHARSFQKYCFEKKAFKDPERVHLALCTLGVLKAVAKDVFQILI